MTLLNTDDMTTLDEMLTRVSLQEVIEGLREIAQRRALDDGCPELYVGWREASAALRVAAHTVTV